MAERPPIAILPPLPPSPEALVRKIRRRNSYAAARRHTRFVKFLKFLLPVGTLLATAAAVAWAVYNPLRNLPDIEIKDVNLSGTQITMAAPKLTGFRRDLEPYEVTASKAVQDVKNMDVIELNDLKAKFILDEKGSVANLHASLGVWNTKSEQLDLKNEVRVTTDNGQQIQLQSATVDIKSGRIASKDPVTVILPNGVIQADSLEVTDNGKTIVFRNRVRTVFSDSSFKAGDSNEEILSLKTGDTTAIGVGQ